MVDIVVIKLKYYQNKQGFIPTNVFLETYEFLSLLDEIKTTLVEIFTYFHEIRRYFDLENRTIVNNVYQIIQ